MQLLYKKRSSRKTYNRISNILNFYEFSQSTTNRWEVKKIQFCIIHKSFEIPKITFH